ncbi:MAG: bifunctional 4-hydroxy-2-oxoglutarate aldolase/2-dehydro-3-deoxy-phosphogluconate aldolase [Chitinophagaceae bacterium]
MEREQRIILQLKQQGVLPLFYHSDQKTCLDVTKALYDAGIRVIEFTNRGEAALENFKALVAARNESMKDLLLATGTIRTAEQATKFIEAGADFLVSPVFDPAVCDIAYMNKVLWIPGCMTPTEIHIAENAGCRLVKLFPGNVVGPSFVAGIKELFPAMEFMPTGGVEVNKENISEWFNAGVCAVGLGSKLISKTILQNKDYTAITKLAKDVLIIIAAIKK